MENDDSSFGSHYLNQRVARWRDGDRAAADELLNITAHRLERLARKMLRGFPAVRGWVETADVLQGACMRLLTALQSVTPGSTRDFFALSALQMRRELLDLAKSQSKRAAIELSAEELVADQHSADDIDAWARFHSAVDALPTTEREIFGLVFYHGWTQVQVAELLDVSERTVRRYWISAATTLSKILGGRLPALTD